MSNFSPNLYRCWHPVAYGSAVSADEPYGAILLDEAVVIWRTAEDPLHRAFGLALAICLLNPKVLHYDAAVLLIPIAMLIARLERGTVELSYLLLAIFVWCLPYWEPAFKAIGAHPGALVLFAGMILTTVKSLPAQAAPHVVSAPDQTAP